MFLSPFASWWLWFYSIEETFDDNALVYVLKMFALYPYFTLSTLKFVWIHRAFAFLNIRFSYDKCLSGM